MTARISARGKQAPRRTNFLQRLLDPIDLLAEAIYSILVLLTFTLAFRIFTLGAAGPPANSAEYATELLLAALGAIVAWGVIDGLMYALLEVLQRSERHRFLSEVAAAATEQERVAVVAPELDYILEPILGQPERDRLYRSVAEQLRSGAPRPVGFRREDLAGAVGSVLIAILAVIPSLAPLLLLRNDVALAIRVSNLVSFGALFVAGYQWGAHVGTSPWRTGLLLLGVGVAMVAVAIPLGG